MFDATLSIRVVLAPQSNELVQVMRTQDWPVSGEIVKVVHDDGDEQVDDLNKESNLKQDGGRPV